MIELRSLFDVAGGFKFCDDYMTLESGNDFLRYQFHDDDDDDENDRNTSRCWTSVRFDGEADTEHNTLLQAAIGRLTVCRMLNYEIYAPNRRRFLTITFQNGTIPGSPAPPGTCVMAAQFWPCTPRRG